MIKKLNYLFKIKKLLKHITKNFSKSIWFFPAILFFVLIVMVSFKVSGTSIGIYDSFFGGGSKDSGLIFGKPNSLRSDEWIVNSQMIIAQANNNYKQINNNIGSGQDMSILLDVPYKEWSVIFKPQNLAFFIMPFDYAFAFKWWIIGYLLVISVYFFTISILPDKKLFASLLALSIFFSPFVQWWYLNATLATIYLSLFTAIVYIKLLKSYNSFHQILWAILLFYVLTCFALILYPPFQIPAALAVGVFAIGYLIKWAKKEPKKNIIEKMIIFSIIIAATALTIMLFVLTRLPAIETIRNTAYPGTRIQLSGGFDYKHIINLLSSHLSSQLQYPTKSLYYFTRSNSLGNASEASNFVLLVPFLLVPSFYLIFKRFREKASIYYPLLFTNLLIIFFILWLIVPGINILGEITLLKMVPHARLVIGLGLLGIVQLVLFIKLYGNSYISKKPTKFYIVAYCILVLIIETIVSLYVQRHYPGYIGYTKAILFSLPIPAIIYLILTKKYILSIAIYLVLSFYMTYRVNPLYMGTNILTKTPISNEIKRINKQQSASWVSEDIHLENFASMNGARSYSGVFAYPQLEIEYIYNRYSHTAYNFDREINRKIKTTLKLVNPDSFAIVTEPCSDFMKDHNIGYIITTGHFDEKEKCTSLIKEVNYPGKVIYIYRLNF